MKDGSIDYRGYSTAELGEALQAIDREKFPLNYGNLVSALRERGQDANAMRRGLPSNPGHETARYSVRFTTTRIVGVAENSFGLTGRGTLEISAGLIQVSGKFDGLMGRQKREKALARAHLVSVERSQRRFRILLQPPGEPAQQVIFVAKDADADAIAQRLHAQLHAGELLQTGEIAEFERRLAAISGGTPVTYGLIAINIAVFVAMAAKGAGVLDSNASVHVAWGSNLVPVTVAGDWWRLGTSMFLHFGLVHLLLNMWVLHVHGRLAERMYGSARFAMLYLLAGIFGSMASAWWHAAANSAGASGAVFGVLGGLLAFMLVKRYQIPVPIIQAHRVSLTAFVVYNIMVGLTHPGIDNAAHLGGFVSGLLMGLVLARPIDAEARSQPQPLRIAGFTIAAALVLVGAGDLARRSKERLSPEERSAAAQQWFTYGEWNVMAKYNDMVGQAKSGQLSDADFAERLAAEIIPFYARAMEQLRFDPAIPENQASFEQALASYVRLRHEALVLMESAARAGDSRGVARAMKVQAAADAAVELVNQAAARTGPT